MGNKREFEIAFVGLKPGVHVYQYNIGDSFFEKYGIQDFDQCNSSVKLSLEKHSGFMQLHFDISGTVNVDCDRCGNPLTKDLWDEFDLIVKLVDEPEVMNNQEEDPDVYYIGRTESYLFVSDWIYEFVCLSVPLQRTCEVDDKGNSNCNPLVIEKLKQMEADVAKIANPLWTGLDKFKDLEN